MSPYPDGRPYFSLNSYYKMLFGKKMARIPIDGGFTCPNRDGTIGKGGCIFCSQRGSGDFVPDVSSIQKQIELNKEVYRKKWKDVGYIAYFQAFTNTYAPVDELRQKYEQALSEPEVEGISIATRPDCLSHEVLGLLSEMNERIPVWVELGLQTAVETTADFICRGYKNIVFAQAVAALHALNIPVVVHIILGLPKETEEDIYKTIAYVNGFPIHGIKLQLLHVLKHTALAEMYQRGQYEPYTMEQYIQVLCGCIRRLRPDIVIYRLTGDGAAESLIAPLWSQKKGIVLNTIHKELKRQQIYQGQDW